jgi:hypothetical protein
MQLSLASYWTPTEVANAVSERRICETADQPVPVYRRLSAPSLEPRVHYQTPDLPGLFRLWAGIRLAERGCAHAIQYFAIEDSSGRPPDDRSLIADAEAFALIHSLDPKFDFAYELSCSDPQLQTCHSSCTDCEYERRALFRNAHS